MAFMLHAANDDGTRNLIAVLSRYDIERLLDRKPLSLDGTFPTFNQARVKAMGITYATDAEMTQYLQLGRQGKTDEVVKLVTADWSPLR
jgi:hypothetical protein